MILYSKGDISRFKINTKAFEEECEKYCICKKTDNFYTSDNLKTSANLKKSDNLKISDDLYILDNLISHSNFVILAAVNDLREGMIDDFEVYKIHDKIEALVYASDMLGIKKIIDKLNEEILWDLLNINMMEAIVVLCNDKY